MTKNPTRSHLDERKTHVLFIGTESGTFNSFDEALKAADSLKNFLKRTCEDNNYHCVGIIGVCYHNCRFGEMKANKFGKREFEPYVPGYVIKTPPHIHILLVANPASTLRNVIYKYFHKKYRRKVTYEKWADENIDGAIRYVLDQSAKVRTVHLFSDELNPWGKDFIQFTETRNYELGNKKRLFPK